MIRTAALYLRTLPHLRPWQVIGRVAAPVRRRLSRSVNVPETLGGALNPRIPFLHHEPWNSREEILQGRFTFLNRSEDLGRPPDWEASHMPLLWRFNLHYFHYLHLLKPEEQSDLCLSWIEANPEPGGVSWHPYPTSHRIVSWIKARVGGRGVEGSLYLQAAHLRRNLETHVYGNHLIENARALVFAGRYFEGQGEGSEWLAKGLRLLKDEADEQILPDGGHYERSPMYHVLMLEVYADVLNVLGPNDPNATWIAALLRKMMDALASMTHPDGRIALFNDATHEIAPSSADIQRYASELGIAPSPSKKDLPQTGYYVHASDDVYLIIDAGPGGPDHLMAHAHADVFSYELSFYGKRVVVDTGVYEYAAGRERQFSRSTKAHNTVHVDGMDQIECWGSFRVARRAAPHAVEVSREGGKMTFRGTFSGYSRRIGDDIEHRRTITIDETKRQIRISDKITGRGSHLVESRIHFHPDVQASETDPATLQHAGRTYRLEAKRLTWERAPYFPRFGVQEERLVAVIGGEAALPVALEYTISY